MENEPIVPFGKHKGKPITTLLNDTKYLEWCKKQEWFKKYHIVYNICVNQTIVNNNESSKTPEHNRIQNLFLEEENVKKFLLKVFTFKILENLHICCNPKDCVKFEQKFNWDLIIDGNAYWYWYCTCEVDECVCDTYKNLPHLLNRLWLFPVYCEIKPVLGDDYPCVLRKMNTQILLTNGGYEESDNKYVLLVKDFSSSTTTKKQLIQIFKQSYIKVVFLNDIIENYNTQIQSYSSNNIDENMILKENIILKEKIELLEKEIIMLKEKIKV